jgi:hypothetical protein
MNIKEFYHLKHRSKTMRTNNITRKGVACYAPALAAFLAIAILFTPAAYAQTSWSTRAETAWYDDNNWKASFTITTAEELAGLAKLVNDGTEDFSGKAITLGNDIALNDTASWKNWATTAPANSWETIGNYSDSPFKGTFDGAGFVISGVYINSSDGEQGLFGCVYTDGTVKDLGVIASYIKGDWAVGGLAGGNSGTIINSYAVGNQRRHSQNNGGVEDTNNILRLGFHQCLGNKQRNCKQRVSVFAHRY